MVGAAARPRKRTVGVATARGWVRGNRWWGAPLRAKVERLDRISRSAALRPDRRRPEGDVVRRLVVLALVGLAAQLVDGSVGMGYGVTSATLLLAAGMGPAAASAAIHLSEIGTTLVSGAAHHALGNT